MTLRPMTMDDADFMLELKNDPQTRKFAIVSHDEIKKEDHYKWLENNLQYFQIIESIYGRTGAVRIQDNEISIWVDEQFRGQGVATYILEMVAELKMTAKIVEGNISSMKCFIRAGFEPIDYKENYYIFQR